MKMKKKLFYMLAVLAVLGTGCDSKLELKNPQSIDGEDALDTDARVKKVLVGNYASFGSAALFGGDVLWMSELLASDAELNWVGTFPDPRMIWGKNMLTNNSNASATWSAAYRVIYNCNNILGAIGVVAAADQKRVAAEAKFLRGMAYFELVKYFGEKPFVAGNAASLKGVPLITAPGPSAPQSEEYKLARSSVQDGYTQVIKDLTEAETDLPAKNGVYANKEAAQLALARVYLQQADYSKALDAANRCITTATANGFALTSTYAAAFNTTANTVEDLFAMQHNAQAGTNSCFTYFSTGTYGARDGDIEVTPKHYNKYETGDQRRSLFFFESGAWRAGKWRDLYRNVKCMRLAEAYITRAECNSRLSSSVGATVDADVNRIRNRAGLASLTNATLAQVLNERELEIAFEGQGAWDAKRQKLTVDGKAWDDPKMTFPIPLREMNVNANLVQNPGY
jgi:tetratricopeptide (TPR) repeat protein